MPSRTFRDVVFRALVAGAIEKGFGVVEFNQVAEQEERAFIAHARGLLHVVGHHDHRIIALELNGELFDAPRGNGVERTRRLVHKQHFRLNRERAGNTQTLLLAARSARALFFRRSFTSSKIAALRSAVSTISSSSALPLMPWVRGPNATLSYTLIGNGFAFWNTMPTRLRSRLTSVSLL